MCVPFCKSLKVTFIGKETYINVLFISNINRGSYIMSLTDAEISRTMCVTSCALNCISLLSLPGSDDGTGDLQ